MESKGSFAGVIREMGGATRSERSIAFRLPWLAIGLTVLAVCVSELASFEPARKNAFVIAGDGEVLDRYSPGCRWEKPLKASQARGIRSPAERAADPLGNLSVVEMGAPSRWWVEFGVGLQPVQWVTASWVEPRRSIRYFRIALFAIALSLCEQLVRRGFMAALLLIATIGSMILIQLANLHRVFGEHGGLLSSIGFFFAVAILLDCFAKRSADPHRSEGVKRRSAEDRAAEWLRSHPIAAMASIGMAFFLLSTFTWFRSVEAWSPAGLIAIPIAALVSMGSIRWWGDRWLVPLVKQPIVEEKAVEEDEPIVSSRLELLGLKRSGNAREEIVDTSTSLERDGIDLALRSGKVEAAIARFQFIKQRDSKLQWTSPQLIAIIAYFIQRKMDQSALPYLEEHVQRFRARSSEFALQIAVIHSRENRWEDVSRWVGRIEPSDLSPDQFKCLQTFKRSPSMQRS
jgi:hypothetical protein